jgi:hypothetical protein
MKMKMQFLMAVAFVMFLNGCSKPPVAGDGPKAASTSRSEIAAATQAESRECLDAAHKILGPHGEVVRCGHLVGDASLEALAVVRLKNSDKRKQNADSGLKVSRLAILRKGTSKWSVELDASDHIRNPAGYIGIDFIDDSAGFFGLEASIWDQRPDDTPGLTIYLYDIDPNGDSVGSGVAISWNPAVGRFQEFAAHQEPEGFRMEIKDPPHWNSACAQSKQGCGKPPRQ